MPMPPAPVSKQGTDGLSLQQAWLSPPFESTQIICAGFDGSATWVTQARPVQFPWLQPPEQLLSFTGTPCASFSRHGFDPPVPGVPIVPVVIGRLMVRVESGLPSGGQSFESWKFLFCASEFATTTDPSTWQAWWLCPPLSHVPFRHCGQTRVASVAKTSEKSGMSPFISPVWRLPMPVASPLKRLMTQTGTPPAISGSGGPKNCPFTEPCPVGPFAVHIGFDVLSHPWRQNVVVASLMTGKLCDVPVQPLSRSVPWPRIVNTSWSGPPAVFFGHVGVVGPHGGVAHAGLHVRVRMSLST